MLLQDRVIILSGLGPGTGIALFKAIAKEGAHIVSLSRSDGVSDQSAEIASKQGVRTLHVRCDITKEEQCAYAVEQALSTFHRVDGLVNNAFASGIPTPMSETTIEEAWRLPFEVNVLGTMKITQATLSAMQKNKRGSIVTINSMAARIVPDNMTAYAASKAALLTAMQGVANEFGLQGIRANSVVPSHIDGPNVDMLVAWESQKRDIPAEQVREEIIAEGVLDHITTTEEIADTVTFLLSDRSRGITGQSIDVNAGQCFV